mgnify:CR=1 FL=1
MVSFGRSEYYDPRFMDELRESCLGGLVFVHKFFTICRMPNIKLQSLDGEVFEVETEIAKQSVTIKTMLEDLGVDEEEDEAIPLPNVNAAILKKVIQWCTYHKVSD